MHLVLGYVLYFIILSVYKWEEATMLVLEEVAFRLGQFCG